jgi:hypothetical protein
VFVCEGFAFGAFCREYSFIYFIHISSVFVTIFNSPCESLSNNEAPIQASPRCGALRIILNNTAETIAVKGKVINHPR